MRMSVCLLLSRFAMASCSKTSASPPSPDNRASAVETRPPGLGEVMLQVRRRFEMAGPGCCVTVRPPAS